MYEGLSDELDERVRNMLIENQTRLTLHQYYKAKNGFEELYELLLDLQPAGKRYHKGHPLHNIGFATFQLGDPEGALKYFLLAYIEDLLSQSEGEGKNADDLPAAKALRNVYRVDESFINKLKVLAEDKKRHGVVVQEPDQMLKEIDQPISEATAFEAPVVERLRKPGQFQSEWKDRVFVGGSYSMHIAEIRCIGEICKKEGFDPIIADLFETPQDKVHHHALMLLHECRRAIFEVSDDVGQLMEIERLRDYQVVSLMLCQKDKTRLSTMLRTLVDSSDCFFQQYGNIEEMSNHVKEFLHQTKN
jgi:hypothetical protein